METTLQGGPEGHADRITAGSRLEERFMGMHQDVEAYRREYSRVDVSVPFAYRIVSPEEKGKLRARFSGESDKTEFIRRSGSSHVDPILEEWINILNAKLDTIIRLLNEQQEGYAGLAFRTVNISGGGMGFIAAETIPLGEILEIKIMLTFQQPLVLTVYGEVVKSDFSDEGHFVAVHYLPMDDAVRDEIVRFVFEREREIIRETRR